MSPSYSSEVQNLHHYHQQGHCHPLEWRKQQLQQLKTMLLENEAAFLQALNDDLGKPAMEAWSMEIAYVTNDIDHCIANLKRWSKPRKVPTPLAAQPASSFIQPEPLGTVLIIGAWNYPLQLTLAPLTTTLAAGNCAVLKPSELAPATSALIAKLLPQYVEPQAVIVVEGGVEETTALLEQRFDHIIYTGNGQVGRIVMSAAAKHLTPVTLELGGKSPVFVDDSCNLSIAAERIIWGKLSNAGQTCVAPDYILTTANMRERLVAELKKTIVRMYGEIPAQSESYGRIVNQRHCQRLINYLQPYLNSEAIAHGGDYQLEDCFIAPTIILEPELDGPLMQEELFGPLLPIITVPDFESAVHFIRQRDKPLAAYLFSTNPIQQRLWIQQLSSGNQGINDTFMFMTVPNLPFGGVGASGIGQYCGPGGFERLSHMKAVIKRPNLKDLPLRFAPYSQLKFKFLRWVR